jgi:hypothetical protein
MFLQVNVATQWAPLSMHNTGQQELLHWIWYDGSAIYNHTQSCNNIFIYLCYLLYAGYLFGLLFNPEDGVSTFL